MRSFQVFVWMSSLIGVVLFLSCSFDWDSYDPRVSGSGATGTVSVAASGSGGSTATGTGSGATGGTAGAGGAPDPGSLHCAVHFPAVSMGLTYMRGVVVDSTGIVVAGPIQGGADFGGGALTVPSGRDSAAIAKLAPDCSHLWSKAFAGATAKTQFWSVALMQNGDVIAAGGLQSAADFGGGVLTPVGNEDALLVRFDAAGNHVWSRHYGVIASAHWTQDVAVDPAGDIVVFGSHYMGGGLGGTPFSGDGAFVAKLSGADGAHLWSVSFPSISSRARSVAVGASGDIFVTGRFETSITIGSNMLTAAGSARDGFVARLDASGNVVWAQRFGSSSGTAHDYGHGVAPVSGGGLILTGRFDDTIAFGSGMLTSAGAGDIFLARLDASGTSLWSKSFGGALHDRGNAMAVDPSGNIVLAGRFEGTTDLGGGPLTSQDAEDLFVARYDPAGNHLWSRRFGAADFQAIGAVGTGADGRIAVTGYFTGVLDFGGGAMTATSPLDGFVAVLWP